MKYEQQPKKKKLSDHIMPHRLVNHTLWLAVEGAVLLVIKKITTPIWKTAAVAIPGAEIPVMLLLSVIGGAFLAACEAVRLYRDVTVRKTFLDAVPGDRYDEKEDSRYLLRCDEFWNDTVLTAILSFLVYIVLCVLLWFDLMIDVNLLTYGEVMAIFTPRVILWVFLWLTVSAAYGLFHWKFSVFVHKKWEESRIRQNTDGELPPRTPCI